MKIEFEGRTWQLEPDTIRNRQAEVVRAHTSGLTVSKWLESLTQDPESPRWVKSWEAMYWLMLHQNLESPLPASPADTDFALYLFANAVLEAIAAAKPAEAEPDPTLPPVASARSPNSATPEKSRSSGRAAGETRHG